MKTCFLRPSHRVFPAFATILTILATFAFGACSPTSEKTPARSLQERLQDRICRIADEAPGMVGVAFVGDTDTVTVNNGVRYPMMSVFKLHEALAVAAVLEQQGSTLDTLLHIKAASLDRETWSPMLKDIGDGDFDISVKSLMKYAVTSSDNNASNILFERIVSPKQTADYIRRTAPDTTFSISWSEHEMKQAHELSYQNCSSPLSAALLIKKVFEEPILSQSHREAIREALLATTTGQDRLGLPLQEIRGVKFGHKTGSGYRNAAGELIAHNDVGYIALPDGTRYALAVMIRDFAGSESEASAIIAAISKVVLEEVLPRKEGLFCLKSPGISCQRAATADDSMARDDN